MITKFIRKEIAAFEILGPDAKRLLATNLIYALAFPFIIVFGSAFILRATGGDKIMTIFYNWGFFSGLILGYYFTGNILKNKIMNIKVLFAIGILLTVIPLCVLMFFGKESGYLVIAYGFLIGVGNGIYWSCRNFLTLLVTNNENLNFYTSVEQFIIIFCNALIPLLFGTFVLGNAIDGDTKMQMYKYTSLVVIATNLIACWLVLKSDFKNPEIKKFIYGSFGSDWQLQRLLTFCVGMVESGFMVLMTLLILTVAGDESVLGKIEFTTAILSIISIYIVGRISKPHHRGRIMLAGATSLIFGGVILAFTITNQNLVLGLTVSFIGVIMMKISQVVADPMVHSAFRATYISSCDKMSVIEKRDSYSYIMDNEYFMNGGRIFGGFVFLVTTYLFYRASNGAGGLSEALSVNNHDVSALRYTFIILALMQLLSAFLIQKINKISVNPQVETKDTVSIVEVL